MVKCFIQMLKLAKTAIIVNFESKQYIFNIPEGFQRYVSDYCIKTKTQTQIFFSNLSVDHVNGILGLLLTLNFDKQIDGTKLYGPQGLCQIIQAFRYSEIGGKNIRSLSCHEFFGKTLIYQHQEEPQQQLEEDQGQIIQQTRKLIKYDEKLVNHIYEDQLVTIQPLIHKQNNISYCITTKKVKGNVSEQKLKDLKLTNIQKKELFQNHQIIIDGQVYTEVYFREPDIEEQSFLILDICDDLDILQINLPQNLKCIFHINNAISAEYINFIKLTKVDHIFCNQEIQNQFSDTIPKTKAICNYLNSLYKFNFPCFQTHYDQKSNEYYQYQTYHYFQILPKNLYGFHQNTPQMIGSLSQIRQLNFQYQKNKEYQSKIRLQFLGTASMRPNKYRNVSGILIQQSDSAIILDCGEGTYNQLEVQQNFNFDQKILIWISHVHCDHHLGLTSFLQKTDNLYLLVPQIMVPWILQIKEFYQIKKKFKICYIPFNEYNLQQEFFNSNCQEYNFEEVSLQHINEQFQINLQYANADHCPQAYGLRINFQDGTSLSYSGDTRPCEQFIKLSENVNIMIHEATFTDDLFDNAIKRKHSTIKEAVQSAILSKAQTLVLTHFSQRYCQSGISLKNNENNKMIIDENTYQQFLKTKTVVALDFLSGQLDEYQDLVELSQELQQIVE